MNTKLYPPQIEGTLPAFITNSQGNIEINIPFAMNKTVSWETIAGFAYKIKSVATNKLLANGEIEFNKDDKSKIQNMIIPTFTITITNEEDKSKFSVGNYYKIQIAYIKKAENKSIIGYFSTVGIAKYTTQPTIGIVGFNNSSVLTEDKRTYVGTYSQQNGDTSEKVYSYRFDLRDENQNIIETSGDLLHNHEHDENNYSSTDTYTLIKALETNKIYTIQYTVKTSNNLEVSTNKYRITEQSTVPPEIDAKLVVTMNEENGYAELRLVGARDESNTERVCTGHFLICRASSEDNFSTWSELSRFVLIGEPPSNQNWKDFTLQHGYTYRYSLQQYNQKYQIYSDRIYSEEIVAKFEHSFLYDGERQLKIKYNPKVSSFKETLLESKTNTLGGKYPFFFRNGNVRYKEFPISGLISYHMDEEELFMTNDELFLEDLNSLTREYTLKEDVKSTDSWYFNNMDANMAYQLQGLYEDREKENSQENRISRQHNRTGNLTDYNMVAERRFKMAVLDFLNDGKPKLFRSPAEGNFIVRLMNSSLSPNDQLGRMLHTFSTTATEIDNYNYAKLNEHNIIAASEPEIKQLRWKTINLRELAIKHKDTKEDFISIGDEENIYSVQFIDMIPGEHIQIKTSNDIIDIVIGVTGAYYVEFETSPKEVLFSKTNTQGQVTYSYYGNTLNHFDLYTKITPSDIPLIQIDGPTIKKEGSNEYYIDILEFKKLQDIKHKVTAYYFLNFTKKTIDPNESLKEENKGNIILYDDDNKFWNKFWIDDQEFDITLDSSYQIIRPGYLPKIKLGENVRLDISLQRREISYLVEEEEGSDVRVAKEAYENAHNQVLNWIGFNETIKDGSLIMTNPNETDDNNWSYDSEYEETLKTLKNSWQKAYNEFLDELKTALEAKGVTTL